MVVDDELKNLIRKYLDIEKDNVKFMKKVMKVGGKNLKGSLEMVEKRCVII